MMTKIAFISDVHMGPSYFRKGVRRKLTEYSESNIVRFLEYSSSEGDFSFAVQLGDLIEDLKIEEDSITYRKGIEILEKCSVPIHHVVGNHDTVHLSTNDLRDILCLESLYYSFDYGDYHFVVLCTQVPDPKTPRIILPDEQYSWLAKDLEATNKPTVIFSHHSFADQSLEGNPWFEGFPEGCLVENRVETRNLFRDSGKVIAIINGHLHWNHVDWHDGIPYITVQSAIENFDSKGTPANAWGIISLKENRFSLNQFGNDPFEFEYSWGSLPV